MAEGVQVYHQNESSMHSLPSACGPAELEVKGLGGKGQANQMIGEAQIWSQNESFMNFISPR